MIRLFDFYILMMEERKFYGSQKGSKRAKRFFGLVPFLILFFCLLGIKNYCRSPAITSLRIYFISIHYSHCGRRFKGGVTSREHFYVLTLVRHIDVAKSKIKTFLEIGQKKVRFYTKRQERH